MLDYAFRYISTSQTYVDLPSLEIRKVYVVQNGKWFYLANSIDEVMSVIYAVNKLIKIRYVKISPKSVDTLPNLDAEHTYLVIPLFNQES
jgi:hypothetical protein